MRVKDAVGRFGEALAAEHLRAAGLVVLDRNWRCPSGEIDLVATDGACLVFVEVKTRSSVAFGDPAEAVSKAKAARIRRLAIAWLADHPQHRCAEVRFDVVSVVRLGTDGPTVRHIQGAF